MKGIVDQIAEAFVTSLASIALAELGDKTQLGLIVLAASIRKTGWIFLGMVAAYTVMVGLGVLVGQTLLVVIPVSVLTIISGLIFLVVGAFMLQLNVEGGVTLPRAKSPFFGTLLMIVFAELGDKTQIVTIALAARFAQPIAVFAGAMLAFVIVDGLSIISADRLGKRLPSTKVKKASAIFFIVFGIFTILMHFLYA